MKRLKIKVTGRVQGVGFRPFVYNLAKALSLRGYVLNSSKGVVIEVEGNRVEEFLQRLKQSPPPLSDIERVIVEEVSPVGEQDFRILESQEEGSFTHVSPDVSVCEECLGEMLDKTDRRYLYPFINCTNCGPRYSITLSLPYDRPNTTMRIFKMCQKCQSEYDDPTNRRFHAQPNACPECGPSLSFRLINKAFKRCVEEDPLQSTINLLNSGAIVAIKGLGGFHIACDALNERAVEKLRERKRKSNKPFALMAASVEIIKRFVLMDDREQELLESNRRPIVLMRKRPGCEIPEVVAPGNRYLGFMLPYTPLHYLLFYSPPGSPENPLFKCLVMTSGNLKEEPIIHRNDDALERLSGLVDAFLFHNRDIFMRVDDSVVKKELFIRRARGYVPEPIVLPDDGPEVLATGADLKNTFSLTKENYAILSQHIGDMENYETLLFFQEVLENLKALYRIKPIAVATDLHPGYLSRQWADSQALPVTYIQHHYAHAMAVVAEHGLKAPVIGVVFDGTGYGLDGRIWGGEFLWVDTEGFQRLAHLDYLRLPGGEMAIKQPWRTAVALLRGLYAEETEGFLKRLGFFERIDLKQIEMVLSIAENEQFSPFSSGAGRYFDALSSIVSLVDFNTHEAEAPMALEAITLDGVDEVYPFDINEETIPMVISLRRCFQRAVDDYLQDVELEIIATRFHNTMAALIRDTVMRLKSRKGEVKEVVLSGGVFQNSYLLSKTFEYLADTGLKVYFHKSIPPNDACISLGQAYILRERLKRGMNV
ncbi:MAG: carbamoyltransferase HypF [Nitrospirae bacterium]|nr:carbamoyltransferase HypF [Nitrospirota bacterium]